MPVPGMKPEHMCGGVRSWAWDQADFYCNSSGSTTLL